MVICRYLEDARSPCGGTFILFWRPAITELRSREVRASKHTTRRHWWCAIANETTASEQRQCYARPTRCTRNERWGAVWALASCVCVEPPKPCQVFAAATLVRSTYICAQARHRRLIRNCMLYRRWAEWKVYRADSIGRSIFGKRSVRAAVFFCVIL